MPGRRVLLCAALGLVLAVASAHRVCDLVFDCGCGWVTARHCNIHQEGPPDCPVCTDAAHAAAFGLTLTAAHALLLHAGVRAVARRRGA